MIEIDRGVKRMRRKLNRRRVILAPLSMATRIIKWGIVALILISLFGGIGSMFGSGGVNMLQNIANEARNITGSIMPDEISNVIENQIDKLQNQLEGYDYDGDEYGDPEDY